MRGVLLGALGIVLMASAALPDGIGLAGTLWQCTRATVQSEFGITFYPGGRVGGGELENDEVSPYIFDASRTKSGEWPGNKSLEVSIKVFEIVIYIHELSPLARETR